MQWQKKQESPTSVSRSSSNVSGMDDTALEMRFSSSDLEELKEKWHKLKSIYDSIPLTTNWQWFLDKGFTFR